MGSPTAHLELGRATYDDALSLQRDLHARRAAGQIDDVVVTVEHEPVFTIGRSGSLDHLLVDRAVLEREGIDLCHVERGGDITYHGPGQLVVYPIVDLKPRGRDVKRFVEELEETAIRTLRRLDVGGARRPTYPGVWVREEGGGAWRKVASIGVYVKKWVTRHGLALNVDVEAEHFAMIRPCGLDVRTISMVDLVRRPLELSAVRGAFLEEMAAVFDWDLRPARREELTG